MAGTESDPSIRVDPIRHFDADAPLVVPVPPQSTPNTELAKQRTAFAQHRTGLANHRTTLATLRCHLANERTHLAYMRTAIALIGFGITLNRFAIYLIQNKRVAEEPLALQDTKSVGLGMVTLGFAMIIWALYRFHRTSRDIELGRYRTDWRAVLVASVIFALLGAITTLWLFLT